MLRVILSVLVICVVMTGHSVVAAESLDMQISVDILAYLQTLPEE